MNQVFLCGRLLTDPKGSREAGRAALQRGPYRDKRSAEVRVPRRGDVPAAGPAVAEDTRKGSLLLVQGGACTPIAGRPQTAVSGTWVIGAGC